jgi:ribonuclease E
MEAAHVDAGGSNGGDDNAASAEPHGDGERRRRRRGRRGGRRNRRDRETGVPPSSDGAPMEADTSEPEHAFEHETEPPQPVHQPEAEQVAEAPPRETPRVPEPAQVETAPSEAARRRSTVREPAPISVGHENGPHEHIASPSEPPQPVVVSPTESDDSDRPRRSGWWSRRMLGKD